jgi:hypothetical protein
MSKPETERQSKFLPDAHSECGDGDSDMASLWFAPRPSDSPPMARLIHSPDGLAYRGWIFCHLLQEQNLR